MRNAFVFSLLLFSFVFASTADSQSGKENYEKLIGRWIRPDGGYVLIIKKVRFDGSIEAVYLNPNRINISKAHVKTESEKINLFVELRDVGYPGSNYTLTYEPDTDRLIGVYHHMVLKEKFDIFFVRK